MMNNRKYLTSTGLLLKSLNEDPANFSNNQNMLPMNPQLGSYPQQHNQSYQHQQSFMHASNQFQFNTNFSNPQLNPIDLFQKNLQNTPFNLPDIMVLPNSMSQQRWQQKPNKQQQSYNNNQIFNKQNKQQYHQQQAQKTSLNKKTVQPSSSTPMLSSSSVNELPETFGLPSNQPVKPSISKHASSSNLEHLSKQSNEILIDDTQTITKSSSTNNDSCDIEIISEISSSNPPQQQTQTQTQISNQSTEDLNQSLKNYLSKSYAKNSTSSNVNISIATKPQSNFISNLNCINQLLDKSDFYSNKLRRCRPYSSLKPNTILTIEDDSDDDLENEETSTTNQKIKNKKIILIDDTNEEMHKPWITPDLIKLIKHRNLLQSKLNESGVDSTVPDAELLKKFKNLRNKVTKLVKKARKDYLTKYIQESKENKASEAKSEATVNQTSVDQSAQASSSTSSTQSTVSLTQTNASSNPSTTPVSSTVNEIKNKLTGSGSFLKDQNTLMMSLYTNYFNQYIQQYTQQQQQAQTLATTAATGEKKEGDDGYDMLQKQAAYYAQQQHGIQTQLEATLMQSAQQLIQEIAEMAAVKSNQPFVLNQFSQQHHMHQHHHHGMIPNVPHGVMPQMISLVPPPPPTGMGSGPMNVAPKMFY